MDIFVVLIEEGEAEAKQIIEAEWKGIRHYTMASNIFLVTEGEPTLAQTIRERIGIAVNADVTGIVVEMKAWSGAVDMKLVEWVRKVREL